MLDNELIELSRMHLQRSHELLKEIPVLIEICAYNSAVNRAYYAAFHALKSVEALDNYDSKKHSGVIAYFRQHYVKTGVFAVEMSTLIEILQTTREQSDYNIVVRFDIDEAKLQFENAARFVSEIEKYLMNRYEKEETE